ncbi:hypothetical protein PHAVU_003G042100 [Phaseolus vulgaris]|uniref:Uncharacterized protein n=2 Tax=Phaseolus vulgaris TaxID=3885 RepID=V7C5T8_PHAVU|nr:hypothetical protein PHAVU_003G042100g [Phaseolus vulgaris]ESW25509.1 hypothetical protein PHAVU_003G042100g [Phaseolus vulgaris]
MDLGHCRPSSEDSKSCEGREVESVQMDGEKFDHSKQDKQEKVFSETIDDSLRSKDSSRESGSSSDSEKQIYLISEVESDNTKDSDTHTDGTKSISSSARKRSSCSSSESSSEDFIAVEEAFKYTKSAKDNVPSCESSDKSEVENNFLVPTSTYEVNNLNHIQMDMSPTASPSVQVMDRSGSYDASIFPSSIFEPNTNPSEWSIASNESLFSIQIQPSFSREKALKYGDLCLSKELTKSVELNKQAPSVILEEIDTTKKNVDVEELQAPTSYGSFKFEGERDTEDNNETKTSHGTKSVKSSKSNVSILSHSDNGILPVPPLKKRSRKGYSYSCSWVFCNLCSSCKCLSCCSPFFCCGLCNRTEYHHHTSQILTEEAERNGSTKMDVSQQESGKHESDKQESGMTRDTNVIQTKEESEVPSNSKDNNSTWFHSLSCPWNPSSNCC